MILDSYRVLDLTDHQGQLCGMVLGMLGADVVKIEPPQGDPVRRMGPFVGGEPHPERGIPWIAHNACKRSVTLDITTKEGRGIFLNLVSSAHFIIESFPPGRMESIGLGFHELLRHNPSLILVSITPFGRTGPRAHWASCDLVMMGMGGQMVYCGEPDGPPLRFAVDQSYPLAGIYAAIAALAAHWDRAATGEGQHVDVSIQECVLMTSFNMHVCWEMEGIEIKRQGVRGMRGDVRFRTIWPCSNGYVSWRVFFGNWGRWTRSLVEWMDELGEAGDLADVRWEELQMHSVPQEEIDRMEEVFQHFFLKHTKEELFDEALRLGIPLFPVQEPGELLIDQQLSHRGFWSLIPYPHLGVRLPHPRLPFPLPGMESPLRRAPTLGEHNKEIYCGELGLSQSDLVILREAGVI